MSSFIVASIALSYLFSGFACYCAAIAHQKENGKNPLMILWWMGWMRREIQKDKVREIPLDSLTVHTPTQMEESETGDWESYLDIQPRDRIGDILQQIALLDRPQVQQILREQTQTRLHFGQIAIQKGWVKPQTIDRVVGYQLQARALQHSAIASR